ncbi:MAG: cartilage oligomeric matrix protein [Candidatus Peregrinibacteria bacterium GW2011_GWC2_39_14]|nr:MAG: Cartilage oligomeric matrix protein [Candidatus Peregrinibacteria bacterium GW2011_GWA2_38_36]KKR06590.1 MAG: cartilage oligomeric matrix protein [Candidatus Peregrinibacteria bacterium GW2011_GWC2_39_14]
MINSPNSQNNRPSLADEAKEYLKVGGMPAEEFDRVNSSGSIRAIGILMTLFAAGTISRDVFGKELDRIVTADESGNLRAITVTDGVVSAGVAVPAGGQYGANEVAFTGNKLGAVLGGDPGRISFRDPKTLVEQSATSDINGPAYLAGDESSDTFAVSEPDYPNEAKIVLTFADGSTTRIIPNPKEASGAQPYVSSVNFDSSGYLYAGTNVKDQRFLQRFSQTAPGQYAESGKAQLPGGIGTGSVMQTVVYNGNVVAMTIDKILIYSETDLSIEPQIVSIESLQASFGIRPGTSELWFMSGMNDNIYSLDISNPSAGVQIAVPEATLHALVPNCGTMIGGFSRVNPNVLDIAQKENTGGKTKMVHFVFDTNNGVTSSVVTGISYDGIVSFASAPDTDGDQINNFDDNCPATPNNDQLDTDGNGVGNACEAVIDQDGDGVIDSIDNCPTVPNKEQIDTTGTGIGDACQNPADVSASTQELYGTSDEVQTTPGHTVFGDADVIQGDPVTVSVPQDSDVVITSTGSASEDMTVVIPEGTDFIIEMGEGSADNADTAGVDFPQSDEPYQGQTGDEGVALAISGTWMRIHTQKTIVQVEETQPEQVEGPAEAVEVVEAVDPDVVEEVAGEVVEGVDVAEGVDTTEPKPEQNPESPAEVKEIVEEAVEEAVQEATGDEGGAEADVSGGDEGLTGTDTAGEDTYTAEPADKGGGGGCAVNTRIHAGDLSSAALTLAMAGVIAAKRFGGPTYWAHMARVAVRRVLDGKLNR